MVKVRVGCFVFVYFIFRYIVFNKFRYCVNICERKRDLSVLCINNICIYFYLNY